MATVQVTTRVYGRFRVPSNLLPDGVNPTQCSELNLDEVDGSRSIWCVNQATCCTYAASQGWNGYHCRDCAVEEPLSRDAQRRDLDGLAMLLLAISS